MRRTQGNQKLLLLMIAALTCSGCHKALVWQPVPHSPSIQTPKDDFTLVWDKEDANGGPLNPYWGLERAQGEFPPREEGQPPYACKSDPYSAACTENKGLVMDPPQFPNSVVCKVGNIGAKFNGHADWVVASQHGCADWEDQSADGDYNFRLFPTDRQRSILTKNNPQFVGLEFDYYETILNSQLKFWTDLRSEVQKENDDQRSHHLEISTLLNPSNPNVNPRVAVTGIFGVDCEHGCKSEIHPVLALAIETNQDPNDNTWVMFVRNWGDEGFCSHYRHLIQFPDNVLNILLFDGTDGDGPTVIPDKTHMVVSEGASVPFPTVSYWQSHGPVVSFMLPDPLQAMAYVELEVHFKWNRFSPPRCTASEPALAHKNAAAEPLDAEDYLGVIERRLVEQQPAAASHKQFAPNPMTRMSEVAIPQAIVVQNFAPPTKRAAQKPHPLATDNSLVSRSIRNVQALCQAYGNHLPPFKGEDLSSQLCDESKLNNELKRNER